MPTFDALESAQGRSLAIKGYESDLVAQAKEHLTTGLDGLRVASQIATTRIGYLTKLYEVTDPPADMALLVTGGLGRGIASPHSDLDIVFLSPDPEAERNRTFLERFLYPLWDAGLTIGHSLHTPESYVALGETELSVLTSILDRRWIAGSEGLARALDALATTTLKEPSYRKLMVDAIKSWTQGVNSATSHRLEPDIKGGAGGLRTLHEVWWAARYIWGVNHWRELLTETPLEANDVDILMYGFRLLLEVRLALHFESPRRQDTLRFEFQSGVAHELGIIDSAHELAAANRLLTSVYRSKRAIRSAADIALEVSLEALLDTKSPKETGSERHGQLTLPKQQAETEFSAGAIMALFRESQLQGKALHWSARSQICELSLKVFTPEACLDPEVRDLFTEIIGTPDDSGLCLEGLHEAGILEKLVPDFQQVSGLVQRDLYHIYTVDAHLVQTGRIALELMSPQNTKHPKDLVAIAENVRRPHVLVMSALMHDIGKGHGHGHSERGAKMSEVWAENFGWASDDADDLVFLVREHLTMMIISQRRDMEDVSLIKRFAEDVESIERLELLTLLTYADAVSTGPEAYNDWKGALLKELYFRTREAILDGAGLPGLQERATLRTQQLLAGHDHDGTLGDFLSLLSPRHVLYHRPSILLQQHALLAQALTESAGARVVADPRRKRWEVIIVTRDRPGLLAQTAGVLAAYGIKIQSALLSVTASGFSLDSFVTRSESWALLQDVNLRQGLEDALVAAARDGVVPETRLSERQRAEELLRRELKPIKPRVLFDSEASERATVVDVFARASVTLLRDIAKTIFEAGASIELARITTEGRQSVDAFYLVDAASRKPLTLEAKNALREKLMGALASE